jgi:hypothetical protein
VDPRQQKRLRNISLLVGRITGQVLLMDDSDILGIMDTMLSICRDCFSIFLVIFPAEVLETTCRQSGYT